MSAVPSNLKYTDSHEWIQIDGDIATIGITDFAQSELGDVVYVDLPTVGRMLKKGDTFGSVESVKTVSDIYAPLTGEVTEVNEALGARSELANSNPYDTGYLIKMRFTEPDQVKDLLDSSAYEGLVS